MAKGKSEDQGTQEPSLQERTAQAQEQGYVGTAATDVDGDGVNDAQGVDTTRSPAYGGLQLENATQDVPGGHPNDPTSGGNAGAGGSSS